MKIAEYYKNNQKLFKNNAKINYSDFVVEKDGSSYLWLTPVCDMLDTYCKLNKYGLSIIDEFVDADVILDKVADTLNRNVYKYNRLFNISLLDYNPLWNVDGTETRTTVHGAQSGTNNMGARTDSNIIGASGGTSENTHSVAGYDANTLNAESKDATSFSNDVQTNNTTMGAQESSFANAEYTDIDTFVRGGNIGVTMSTQLLEAEVTWLAKYDVVATIVNDVISELCLEVY